MSDAYREAGVNLELGDELSQMLYEVSKQTWSNRAGQFGEPNSAVDSFSGLRGISLAGIQELPDPAGLSLHMGDDGVGTKVEVAQRVGNHSTIAHDLLAMVCDDAAIRGYEPAAVTTTLDVEKLSESMRPDMEQLARGYFSAAALARVALVNGEVAELGSLVGGYRESDADTERFRYNWSATLMALGHRSRLLDGTRVSAGDFLVGFRENGFRSNGLSLVRKILTDVYGERWHKYQFNFQDLGSVVLTPSTIYTPVLVDAIGGADLRNPHQVDVHAAAHITGGGMPGKVGRMLAPSGLGAEIDSPFEPSDLMLDLVSRGQIPDEEAYKVWNMGVGLVAVTPTPKYLSNLAREHGVESKIIGVVTQDPEIAIRSSGVKKGSKLTYPLSK